MNTTLIARLQSEVAVADKHLRDAADSLSRARSMAQGDPHTKGVADLIEIALSDLRDVRRGPNYRSIESITKEINLAEQALSEHEE
jgi:hypothetical protein